MPWSSREFVGLSNTLATGETAHIATIVHAMPPHIAALDGTLLGHLLLAVCKALQLLGHLLLAFCNLLLVFCALLGHLLLAVCKLLPVFYALLGHLLLDVCKRFLSHQHDVADEIEIARSKRQPTAAQRRRCVQPLRLPHG
jgi:hypothetical protein